MQVNINTGLAFRKVPSEDVAKKKKSACFKLQHKPGVIQHSADGLLLGQFLSDIEIKYDRRVCGRPCFILDDEEAAVYIYPEQSQFC